VLFPKRNKPLQLRIHFFGAAKPAKPFRPAETFAAQRCSEKSEPP
jgi:hypothetical protein